MTDNETIKMAEHFADKFCNNCNIKDSGFCDNCIGKVLNDLIGIIKRQQEEIERLETEKENHPLTPEELKQMVGQPVWTVGVSCTADGTWSRWDIVENVDDYGVEFGYSTEAKEWWSYDLHDFEGNLHAFGWVCYRAKPEVVAEMEGENEENPKAKDFAGGMQNLPR